MPQEKVRKKSIFHARMKRYSRELSFSRQHAETLSSKISPLKVSETFFDSVCCCASSIYHHINNDTTKKSFVDLHHHLRKTVGVGGRVRFEILLRT